MKNPIDLAAEAAAFADQYQMLPQGSTVLCAVSGGKDSMALLSVLQTLAPERNLMIHAAHFNHQLRGEESQRDEDFVSKWCADHNIPLTIGSGDVAQAAQEQGKGIEETARAMRYGFLTETAQEVGAEKIATAHNADDNAETVLLHLVRGSGLDGLTGIPPVRGILIRPLLGVPRIDIEVYLAQENIPHVEDSSNQDTKFARNRIRQAILPVMKDLNPAFVSTLSANLVHLREDRELLYDMAESVTCDALVEDGKVSLVKVNMGMPDFRAEAVPVVGLGRDVPGLGEGVIGQTVTVAGKPWTMTCLSMGNPHAVVWVDDVAALPLEQIGPAFEHAPYFPDRVNTEFVQVLNDREINMRVWERGSGETLACGTGACASVAACYLNGRTGAQVMVHLRGGDLAVELGEDGCIYMTGPATTVFEGEING